MAPPPDIQAKAAECLAAVRLINFSAALTHLNGGQSTQVRWNVDISQCPHVELLGIYLDTSRVAPVHSLTVRPAKTSGYVLIARAAAQMLTLGTVHIDVDDSACQPLTFPASGITPQIVETIADEVQSYNKDPSNTHKIEIQTNDVSIDPFGIKIHLRLEIDINDFPDPVVEISATIAISVLDDGTLVPFYQNFSIDVHWPWYVKLSGITAIVSAIVNHFISEEVSGKIKNAILDGFKAELAGALGGTNTVITNIATAKDKLIVTICPPG